METSAKSGLNVNELFCEIGKRLFIDTEIVFCLLFSDVLITVFFDLFFFVNFILIYLSIEI